MILSLFALLTFTLLVVRTTAEQPSVIKSDLDQRAYRVLELDNGLRVLLVSDNSTDTSAASMDVRAGSFDEPDSLPGLAHYLEHCLFLGSAAYPAVDAFSGFLAQHHGSDNAFTAAQHTNYMFDVSPENLAGALDIWAGFFTAPLFSANATGKEVQAVNAEHNKNLNDDNWRFFALTKDIADPRSPYHRFSTGDTETLQTIPQQKMIDVRQALIAFHNRFYVPQNMRLAVYGRESLDELATIVTSRFGAIKASPPDPEPRIPLNAPYGANFTGARVLYAPVKESRSLSVLFQLPPVHLERDVMPLSFASFLLGHEGVGSLQAYLRARGWALSVGASSQEETQEWIVFGVSVELTELGLANVDAVIAALFSYLGVLRAVDHWMPLWNETKTMDQVDFTYADKVNPYIFVTQLSAALQDYDGAHVLVGPAVPQTSNATRVNEVVKRTIAAFGTDAFNVLIGAPEFATVKPNRHERWYSIDYYVEPLNATLVQSWSALLTAPPANDSQLSVPMPNQFLPTNLAVVVAPGEQQPPTQITSPVTFWLSTENVFLLPKAVFTVQIIEPRTVATLEADAASSLWIALVLDRLREQLYPATLAGLSLTMSRAQRGTFVQVSGFNDKLGLLLLQALAMFMTPPSFVRFDDVRNATIRGIVNSEHDWPVRRAHADSVALLASDRSRWGVAERLRALKSIATESDLRAAYVGPKGGCADYAVQMHFHGNLDAATGRSLASSVRGALDCGALTDEQTSAVDAEARLLAGRVARLEDGDDVTLSQATVDGEPSGGVSEIIQVGELSRRMLMLVSVLSPVVGEQAFNELRTLQQLGYVVWSYFRAQSNVGQLYVEVQSSVISPDDVAQRIDTFLFEHMPALLNATSDETWSDWLAAAVSSVEAKPRSAAERATFFWGQIAGLELDFDPAPRDAKIIKSLQRSEAVWFWQRYFLSPQRRRLTVMRWPVKDIAQKTWQVSSSRRWGLIGDQAQFRREHALYPTPITPMSRRLALEDTNAPIGAAATVAPMTVAACAPGTPSSTSVMVVDDRPTFSTLPLILGIALGVVALLFAGTLWWALTLRKRAQQGSYYTHLRDD
jgi:insulysin